MYSKTELKLYGLQAIKESSIPNEDKLILANDLKEADLVQTMAFLNKGQMINSELTEAISNDIKLTFEENKLLNDSLDDFLVECYINSLDEDIKYSPDRFAILFKDRTITAKNSLGKASATATKNLITGVHKLSSEVKLSDKGKFAGLVIAGLIIAYVSLKIVKAIKSKLTICGKLTGNEKTKCEAKLKIAGYKQAIAKLESLKSTKCVQKSKDPEKCKEKVDEKIKSYKNKIEKYQSV